MASQSAPEGLKFQVDTLRKSGLIVSEPRCHQNPDRNGIIFSCRVSGEITAAGDMPSAVHDLNTLHAESLRTIAHAEEGQRRLNFIANNSNLLSLVIESLPDDATPHLEALQTLISKVVIERAKGVCNYTPES